jgi:hypothetical protein
MFIQLIPKEKDKNIDLHYLRHHLLNKQKVHAFKFIYYLSILIII